MNRELLALVFSGLAASGAVLAVVLYALFSWRLMQIQKSFQEWQMSQRSPVPVVIGPMNAALFGTFPPEQKRWYQEIHSQRSMEETQYCDTGFTYLLHLFNPGDTAIYEGGRLEVVDRESGERFLAFIPKLHVVVEPRTREVLSICILVHPSTRKRFLDGQFRKLDIHFGYINATGEQQLHLSEIICIQHDRWPKPE